jgi:very-short-patch-repair endonuclease
LAELGVPAETITYGLRSNFLFRVFTGVYSVGRPGISEHGLWMACVLASGRGAALAGRTAAIVWGFQNRPQSPVCVVRPGSEGRKEWARLKAHGHNSRARLATSRCRWLEDEHITRFQGIPILQLEPLLLQLAGQMSGESFQYAFWEADRKKGLNDRRLERCVELSRGLKGGADFRESVDCRLPHIQDALSLLEVLLMDLCRREHLPPPEVNRNEQGHLVDFRWSDRRLAVEVDGYEFHRGHGSFERDAERDNDLRAAGWTVLRFTYRMLRYRPDYVKATILKALGSGATENLAGIMVK